jgi:hypothetical protein
MSMILSALPHRPRIEAALATVSKLIKRLTAPVPEPVRRERRSMNG